MILSSFSYRTKGWELKEFNALQLTNLLVGKNASGKSRTIGALQNVASFISMKPTTLLGGLNFETTLTFVSHEDDSWKMEYAFEIENGIIKSESLYACNRRIIHRNLESAFINEDSIDPPQDKLVTQVRRDRQEYPEVEYLMKWAEGIIVITCSNIIPFTLLGGSSSFLNPISLSDLVNSLSIEDKKKVINNANELGYYISDITLIKATDEIKIVAVKEKYIEDSVMDLQLSSGMLRVIYALCFLEYLKYDDKYSLLLIDDLGEGLDYQRATLLGKKVFEACESNGLQLIASSNDSFMMDVVDISKWQILRRKKGQLSVLSQANTPKLFSSFRLTGLSNFDLFSSDYIETYLTHNRQ